MLLQTELDKQQFKTWLEALRSGKYEQTILLLQSSDGYCCLGVACEVLIPDDKKELDFDGHLVGGTPISQTNAPEWLKSINDDMRVNFGQSIMTLNDSKEYSFEKIADILEKEYFYGTI